MKAVNLFRFPILLHNAGNLYSPVLVFVCATHGRRHVSGCAALFSCPLGEKKSHFVYENFSRHYAFRFPFLAVKSKRAPLHGRVKTPSPPHKVL